MKLRRDVAANRQIHVGGLRNPWRKWVVITISAATAIITATAPLFFDSLLELLALLAYAPYVFALVMYLRWDRMHPRRKIYKTWHP